MLRNPAVRRGAPPRIVVRVENDVEPFGRRMIDDRRQKRQVGGRQRCAEPRLQALPAEGNANEVEAELRKVIDVRRRGIRIVAGIRAWHLAKLAASQTYAGKGEAPAPNVSATVLPQTRRTCCRQAKADGAPSGPRGNGGCNVTSLRLRKRQSRCSYPLRPLA